MYKYIIGNIYVTEMTKKTLTLTIIRELNAIIDYFCLSFLKNNMLC